MKVIFLQDVPKVARAGEIKEVADGYGRNFLIPQKLALPATPEGISRVEAQSRALARIEANDLARAAEVAKQLEGIELVLKVRAGAEGRLYGSVTNADIATELERSAKMAIDKRKIDLETPIRETGSYEVNIKLAKDTSARIRVVVEGQE